MWCQREPELDNDSNIVFQPDVTTMQTKEILNRGMI